MVSPVPAPAQSRSQESSCRTHPPQTHCRSFQGLPSHGRPVHSPGAHLQRGGPRPGGCRAPHPESSQPSADAVAALLGHMPAKLPLMTTLKQSSLSGTDNLRGHTKHTARHASAESWMNPARAGNRRLRAPRVPTRRGPPVGVWPRDRRDTPSQWQTTGHHHCSRNSARARWKRKCQILKQFGNLRNPFSQYFKCSSRDDSV